MVEGQSTWLVNREQDSASGYLSSPADTLVHLMTGLSPDSGECEVCLVSGVALPEALAFADKVSWHPQRRPHSRPFARQGRKWS